MVKDSEKVAKVIIKRGRTALFLQKPTGEWELPGGHIHLGEKSKIGAKREVMEETGIRISKLKTIVVTKNFKLYAAMPRNSKVNLSDEHTDYTWVTKQQVKQLKLSNSTKINLKFILDTI